MNNLQILMIILGIIVIGVLWWAYKKEQNKPKWLKLYEYLQFELWGIFLDDDRDYNEISNIKYHIINKFSITEEQAQLCINKWNNKEWFSNQEWLKNNNYG